jgi:uncharacterized protein (TIGR03067 family)
VLESEAGAALPEDVYDWSKRWMEAERAMLVTKDQWILATKGHLHRMTSLRQRSNIERVGHDVDYYYLEAQSLFARANPAVRKHYEMIESERRKLQGRWKVETAQENGKAMKGKEYRPASLEVIGGHARLRRGTGSVLGFITLSPSSEPKAIDVFGLNRDFFFGKTGIYRIDGDRLVVCWRNHKRDRPVRFSSAGDKDLQLLVMKRVKSKKKGRD